MNPSIKQVADQYTLNNWLLWKAVGDIKESDMYTRPDEKANSMHWLVGHMTTSRYGVAGMLGIDDKPAWGEIFNRGTEALASSELPSLDELKKAWDDISAKMTSRLGEVTEDELSKEPPWQPPIDEKTIRGAIAFLSLHESYHVGQMAYIRRLLGYDQLVG